MKITNQIINELAHLSRLEFEGAELEQIKVDLEKITQFCEKLNDLDTENVSPLIYLNTDTNVFREDLAIITLSKENALLNAPKSDSDFFRVPKVIKTIRG